MHYYKNEDQVLQDLIETNIRQRGDVGGSAKKVGKRIKELERIYEIEHGGDRKSTRNNCVLNKTQEQLASDSHSPKLQKPNNSILIMLLSVSNWHT